MSKRDLHRMLFVNRRAFWYRAAAILSLLESKTPHATVIYPAVQKRPLHFPRDHGAHPEFRTEWWYLTGLCGEGDQQLGFQITFFRSRTQHPADNPSRFSPTQLLFAHAAIAQPERGSLYHADRTARNGSVRASFSQQDTDVMIDDWFLKRTSQGYRAEIFDRQFSLIMNASTSSPIILRGQGGVSAKGPEPELASYYYSRPQIPVQVAITLQPKTRSAQSISLSGKAWLDHEWSSSLLMSQAVGWDWIGINLHDGSSLMAFRIRSKTGNALWWEWDWRSPEGVRKSQGRTSPVWTIQETWRSARSQITYPIQWRIEVDGRSYELLPIMADQEIDARASTGGYYWEGAVTLRSEGQSIGIGYLELTGYGEPIRL